MSNASLLENRLVHQKGVLWYSLHAEIKQAISFISDWKSVWDAAEKPSWGTSLATQGPPLTILL